LVAELAEKTTHDKPSAPEIGRPLLQTMFRDGVANPHQPKVGFAVVPADATAFATRTVPATASSAMRRRRTSWTVSP
jgi:hypothetical protein